MPPKKDIKEPTPSIRAKKKKNNDDPLGVSQSKKSRKQQKKGPEKSSKPSALDKSVKKKRIVISSPAAARPSKESLNPKRSARERLSDKKLSEKKSVSVPSSASGKKDKAHSPKYDWDPKLIETPNVKKLKVETTLKSEEEKQAKKELLARPESIRTGLKKCVHMWPTPADIEAMKGIPKPWSIPIVRQTQNLEYYLGRIPQWYVEEKFLKNPGDYAVFRDATNNFILSVKTKEAGNPCVHFIIEFAQTHLIRNDRNHYHRIVGTVLQSNTVQGLLQKYKDSQIEMLKTNTKREAELLTPILPCQSCIYSLQEYNYHYVFVRNPKDVKTGEQIVKGEGYRLFKGTRTVVLPTITESTVVRPVIIKEYDAQNAESLDLIVREMHIVQTIRFKLGVNTVVNIEGINTVQKPLQVLYKVCSEGSLMEYLEAKKEDVTTKDKIALLRDIACTLYQVYKLGYLHCDIRADNMFVDVKEIVIKHPKEVTDPKKPRFLVGGWKNAVMEKTKKFDAEKFPVASFRYLAPEVFKTNLLNEATDVYAFGMLIYEVFLKQKPFKDVSDADVKKQIQEKPTERPAMTDGIPTDVQKLIQECLEEDATKRPAMIEVWRKLRGLNDSTGAAAAA